MRLGCSESLLCAMAPPTGRYAPPLDALCPPWHSPGSSTAAAFCQSRTLWGVTGAWGSRWPGPVNRFCTAPATMPPCDGVPPSAPVGSASTGATSAFAPANQLVFCHQLAPPVGSCCCCRGDDSMAAAVPHRRRCTLAGSSEGGMTLDGLWAAVDARASTGGAPSTGPRRNRESASASVAD